jgi:hypothetical protein
LVATSGAADRTLECRETRYECRGYKGKNCKGKALFRFAPALFLSIRSSCCQPDWLYPLAQSV